MNLRSALEILALLSVTSLITGSAMSVPAPNEADVDTFVVRMRPSADPAHPRGPAEALGQVDVGERFCRALHCVVLAGTPARVAALRGLETRQAIDLEPLPDAHRVFFRAATYNARTAAFETDYPGREDAARLNDTDVFVVVFKAHPDETWVREIEKAGMTPLESLQTMAFLFFGPRGVAESLTRRFAYVYAVADVPPAVRRRNLDAPLKEGPDSPDTTTVMVVERVKDAVLRALTSIDGVPPTLLYRSGPVEMYSAYLSQRDSQTLSLFPEVVSISRRTNPAIPSDERYNRLVAGNFQSAGTSWVAPLPSNNGWPRYWDNYLSQLSGIGISPSGQTIGFVDTGVDSGLQRAGTTYCPPYLRPPGYPADPCKLVFTADVTSNAPESQGDDRYHHGTIVTSVAAGFASFDSPGRDTGGYSFTQGVAPGAKIAICQFFSLCGSTYRTEGEANPFRQNNPYQKLQYALVSLGSTVNLPDNGPGPGAGIINHSWNRGDLVDYEETAHLLDETTRSLKRATFLFRDNQRITGPDRPVLHIVSAGNITTPDPEDVTEAALNAHRLVATPAVAKNVISVGGTEGYNQEAYTIGLFPPYCENANLDNADNPHQIGSFSRFGFPNLRLKPDLVAPGTRAYGRRSAEYVAYPACSPNTSCNMDLDGTGQYGWANGTSFSAPAVSGAAALVREWLISLGSTNPSPALVKAALIATARSLTNLPACSSGCQPCCATCGDVRPAPDKYQGFGAVSLDRFFRASSNYYRFDQGVVLLPSGNSHTQLLTIADNTKDINIALVWTDRAGPDLAHGDINLQNDLDLTATIGTYNWYGNVYYTTPDACTRDGYSLRSPSPVTRDHKNNVERITIRASDIPYGATQILLQITPFSITGDGIEPATNSTFRQDFALFAENAR